MSLRPLSTQNLPFFFFNDTATTEIYTLSLHDALPICVADANAFPRNAEVLTHGMFIPAHDHYRPRTHMFLLTDDAGHPFVTIVGKGLGRMLQQAWLAGCLGGRHGWRQIDQPFWIGGKATHDLQRCDGVFF